MITASLPSQLCRNRESGRHLYHGAKPTYLIVVTAIKVQTTSDSTPRIVIESGAPPVRPSTVFSV
jgi:hypothetical protein